MDAPPPEQPDDYSDAPTLDGDAATLVEVDPNATVRVAAAAVVASQSKVGHYAIVSRLGEGGMGVVYEALQENPRRAVALKIIRGAFADDHAVRMFQREAQVLGRLKHPGIAAIYESGRTDDGQYFFAMELVRGLRLDEYLRRQERNELPARLLLRHRLQLFLRICEAVSYAHQRGVIHRDLKPANILVQEPETHTASSGRIEPEIKILDFGLARITEDELGGMSLATQPGTIQGTVPYMSPEQVRGLTDQLDVRSDVYALGVILYETIAGEMPYDLRKASLPEAARIICEVAPKPLGGVLAKSPLGRDLAVIAAKALEKDPDRRYQSAAALAEDLHRALNDQPILAQSPSTVYQLRKLVARHKAGFGFLAVLVVLLTAFAVTMALDASRIAQQRDRANREAQVAEQVSNFLINLFQVSKPERAQGKVITARELLDKGAASIQGDKTMDPEVKASLLNTMGSAYSSLGFFKASQPLLETALTIRKGLFGGASKPVAQSLRDLGLLARSRGETAQARDYFLQSLALFQKTEGPVNDDVAKLLNDVGTTYIQLNQLAPAREYLQKALAMRIEVSGPSSPGLIAIRGNLGDIAYVSRDYAAAADQFRQELALATHVYGPVHPFVSSLTTNLGGALFQEQKYQEAERYYRQALELDRKLLGDAHPDIGLDLANLAETEDAQGRLVDAARDYRQALAILVAKVPPVDARLRFVQTNLGSVLVRLGGAANLRAAEVLLRAALAADQKALPPGSWDIANAQSELGGCLLAQGQLRAAETLLVGALPTLRSKLADNDARSVPRALQRLVAVERRLGKVAEAARYQSLLRGMS